VRAQTASHPARFQNRISIRWFRPKQKYTVVLSCRVVGVVPPASADLTSFLSQLTIPHLCKKGYTLCSRSFRARTPHIHLPNARAPMETASLALGGQACRGRLVQTGNGLHGAHARTRARGFPADFLGRHATSPLPRSLYRPPPRAGGRRRVRRTWPRSRVESAGGVAAQVARDPAVNAACAPASAVATPVGSVPSPSVSTWSIGGE